MRRLKQLGLGLLGLVALLVLSLVGAIVVDGLRGGQQVAALTNTTISGEAGPEVRAFVARPEGHGPFPAVIMIHEFWGLNEEMQEKAAALAREGYVVVAPDLFRGSSARWVPRAIFQVITNPPEQVNQDLGAVVEWLTTQPQVDAQRIAVMGFCFGGRSALRYSLIDPRMAATIVFYGSPVTDPVQLQALSGPVLGVFGGADNSIPLEVVYAFEQALDEASIPNEVTIYEGQPHAFVTSMEAVAQGGAPAEAWAQLVRFLRETLQEGEAQAPVILAAQEPTFDSVWGYALRLAFEHTIGSGTHHHP